MFSACILLDLMLLFIVTCWICITVAIAHNIVDIFVMFVRIINCFNEEM